MEISKNPSLYQINARTRLSSLSRELHRVATLDDLAGAELDSIAADGFELVYLLGVWKTGEAGRAVSRENPSWREEFARALPDLTEDDICGSCFAVTGYEVAPALGGDDALARLRARLHKRGLGLILDFVPNHTAPDHPWVTEHPDYYVSGTQADLARQPQNYLRMENGSVLAYGRDPYFDGWPDTLQLDYANPALQRAMLSELARVAERCDGVRCDMAMLILPDVFEWTWGRPPEPFWPGAVARIKSEHPGFLFMAEVYWGREWDLQQQGFDYTYDKRLYDRLIEGDARKVRDHLGPTGCSNSGPRGSWRIMTSRGRRRRSPPTSIGRRRSSPSSARACGSSMRANRKGPRSAFPCTFAAGRSSLSTKSWRRSTGRFLAAFVPRRSGKATGNSSKRIPPGTAIGRTTASWCRRGRTARAIGSSPP